MYVCIYIYIYMYSCINTYILMFVYAPPEGPGGRRGDPGSCILYNILVY